MKTLVYTVLLCCLVFVLYTYFLSSPSVAECQYVRYNAFEYIDCEG